MINWYRTSAVALFRFRSMFEKLSSCAWHAPLQCPYLVITLLLETLLRPLRGALEVFDLRRQPSRLKISMRFASAKALLLAYLEKSERDAEEDTSQPELVGELAYSGRRAGLQVKELHCVGL